VIGQPDNKGVEMALTARHIRLAAIAIATAVASSLAPGAAASSETLNVNPSTGYATPALPPGDTVQVNPSTGYASVGQPSTARLAATPSSPEPPTAGEASSGFDWASAGIGAAAGAGLVLVLMLSAATVGVGGLRRARRAS
jgi:hypothetical protein